MNNPNFWTINTNVQIATALILIVILLVYIASRLSSGKKTSRSSRVSSRI